MSDQTNSGGRSTGWPMQNIVSAAAAALLASAVGWLVSQTVEVGKTITGVQRDIMFLGRDQEQIKSELRELNRRLEAGGFRQNGSSR